MRPSATPDDAAVKAYYDAHKAEYMTPETVNLRYVEISLAQLAAKVSVDDAQLKAYYEEQKTKTPERFTQAEQRRVRHILLPVTDPKDDAAVKAKAEGILEARPRRARTSRSWPRNSRRIRAPRSRAAISAGRSARCGWRRSPMPPSA